MADDQRSYRSSDATRGGQARASSSGSDPLAELARLIGQSDPFGEYARDNGRRPAAQPAETAPEWTQPPAQEPPTFASPTVQPEPPTQSYGAPALADPYPAEEQIPAYLTQRGPAVAQDARDAYPYDHATYDPHQAPYGAEQQDFYDDPPPSRRRMGIMAIAGIFALAVLGTAGAVGYRAIFGSSGTSGQPPVIKAETAPSKVVPAGPSKDAASNKLITDRVGGSVQSEKLVSRQEQPMEVRDRPAGVVFPGGSRDGEAPPSVVASMGSGVVGSEPKKIRTIAIHPDGTAAGEPAPAPEPPRSVAPVQSP
ncbi:MAG: hypothetical protein ACK4UO_17020, partial [Pseudolabrys sp.]